MRTDLFAQAFLKVLKEADQPSLERKAMEGTLDSGTNPEDFDTNMDMPDQNSQEGPVGDEVADAMSRRNEQMVKELQVWIDEIEQFLNFLNSEEPTSIQSRLAAAVPDTVMDKMKQSQQTKISRVASDLASLHQNFLGFMAQTSNSRYKYVAIPLTFGLSILGGLSMIGSAISNFC